jgi:predicted ATPase/DNA-binding SARP family transcriptional activator
VRLRLFGAFAVSAEIEPVRGGIPQAVIARLAIARGSAVGTDELVGDLWSAPPPTVVSSLRAHISRLRSRGWGDRLSSGRTGYRLEVDAADVDILRYEDLLNADGAHRLDDLLDAERLWTGVPLASLDGFPFVPSVRERLGRLRRGALEEAARLHMDAGDEASAAALLDAVTDDAGLVALRARALARSGRSADALDLLDAFAASASDGAAPELLAVRRRIVRREEDSAIGTAAASRVQRTGIPLPLTRFVGRERELEAVRRGRAESRLVTLTGAAGVGKTRLAVEAARRADVGEDDAQRLIDLTGVAAPAQVVAVVADSVGAAEHSVEAVARMLTGSRTLLILDNAEHVLGAVATLCSALLERCEGLSVLVTSREAMRMAGERVIVVDPLLGDAVEDAVTLFLQRATDASGIVSWPAEERERVRHVCRTLDGLPLAIELAAARLDVLTVQELADSLHAPPTSGREDGRHDSIDGAIAWSMRLVSADERAVLAQLVCFSGSFTLEAVAAVCIAEGADPRELTVSLARRSLVTALAAESGQRRFRVLEAVRRHVRDTDPLADPAAWHRRHAAFLSELAERLAPRLRTPEVREVKASYAAWRADLDDALTRAIGVGDRATAVRLVAALSWYWYERGLGADAVHLVERALSLTGDPLPDLEAAALHAAAFIRAVGTDPWETVRATRRFAAAAGRAERAAWPTLAHVMLAYIAAGAGEEEEADRELSLAAAHRERIAPEDAWARADELMIRGDALRALGRPAQALEVLDQAYRLAGELGHPWALKGACFVTGKVLTEVGRPREAIGILRTGAIRSLESDDATSAFAAVNAAAAAFVRLDRASDAAVLFGVVDHTGARFAYHPEGSDGEWTQAARAAARRALTEPEWDAAYARGAGMDLRAVMDLLAAFR